LNNIESKADLFGCKNLQLLLANCSTFNDALLALELNGVNTSNLTLEQANLLNEIINNRFDKISINLYENFDSDEGNGKLESIYLDLIKYVIDSTYLGRNHIVQIYKVEAYLSVLQNLLKSKFHRLNYNHSLNINKKVQVSFFSFKRNFQKLIVNFTEYIVAKYIHKISLVKNDGLQNHLQNFNYCNIS
jgi:hypothetical protein